MPTRVDIDQSLVLTAIVKTLINNFPGKTLNDKTCYACLEPDAPENPIDDLYVTVSVGDGTFDGPLFTGGGPFQLCETCGVVVAIWRRAAMDQPAHGEELYGNLDLGILHDKRKVLVALACGPDQKAADLFANYPEGGSAGTGQVNNFLRNWLTPKIATNPKTDPKSGYVGLAIQFEATFDWDLTS